MPTRPRERGPARTAPPGSADGDTNDTSSVNFQADGRGGGRHLMLLSNQLLIADSRVPQV
jgi:hypothetical protein